ncbi:MAG TPA: DUF1553 domain-containing protein [Gemmataceae bacterium]|jgi:hypothetical protein|nr:DUF1553 domain-containing protein [Gemmataceae bacterium]
MSRRLFLATFGLVVVSPLLCAAEPASELTRKINESIAARQTALGIRPSPLADDSEYLRRVYLDLAGRIPGADEVGTFLTEKSAEKRTQTVDRLLNDDRYVEHFANVWRHLLVPELMANVNIQAQNGNGFDGWLKKQIADNVRYDQFARELLTVPFAAERIRGGKPAMNRPTESSPNDPSPSAFYTAKEAKPENLAASTARILLGVRIECAQCHDHPQGHWSREQFWSYAAFFAGLSRNPDNAGGGIREIFDKREMTIPGSSTVVEAEFLGGGIPQWKFNVGSRVTLAEWVTAPDNPYFAKAAVNRLWAHFFGVGLVDPEDDLRKDNPPSHPELLDELAKEFVAHGFDVQYLVRAITATDAYQRTSAVSEGADLNPRAFTRMSLKRLTPEQLFDSLAAATGYREPTTTPDPRVPVPVRGGARGEFLNLFSSGVSSRTEVQLSIPQALLLMNGRFVSDALQTNNATLVDLALKWTKLDTKTGSNAIYLATVVGDPKFDTAGRLESLFLATLSRKPTPAETEKLVRYVEGANDSKRALAGVFWMLLNSAEFIVNH